MVDRIIYTFSPRTCFFFVWFFFSAKNRCFHDEEMQWICSGENRNRERVVDRIIDNFNFDLFFFSASSVRKCVFYDEIQWIRIDESRNHDGY